MAAEISFENLKKEYQNFANPVAHVEVVVPSAHFDKVGKVGGRIALFVLYVCRKYGE